MSYVHTIQGGKTVRLGAYDPKDTQGLNRAEAAERMAPLAKELDELDDLHYYAGQHALLIVLQGRDTSGKDGLIRHLLTHINAQSCNVIPFKVPTKEDLRHDFLWRIHPHAPGRGSMAIFNRSHYEDVLVVRVHNLVPEEAWRRRYDHINAFERLLSDSNTILLKFYLHISKEEQEERLLDREKEVEKSWKLNAGDWKERELWDRYTEAYEEALSRCSIPEAPWHLVPADKKWFRNLAVTERIVETLRPYRAEWMERLEQIGVEAKRELEAYRAQRKTG